MPLVACIWALTCPEEIALTQIADAGFTHIDIRPSGLQTPDLQQRAKDLGLAISCMAASAEMPAGASLAGDDPQPARDHVCRAFEHAALLGATTAYLVPKGDDPDRFAESLIPLADSAQNAGLKLAIEHFPGTFLPTVPLALEYLEKIGHANLYLLFDIGHAQMANENPADMIALAGDRLAYVHLDDNDGESDLHLGLCDGVLTPDALRSTFAALQSIHYTGNMSLELKSDIPNPLAALKKSRRIVLENLGRGKG